MNTNHENYNKLKFLIVAADKYPPFRSDVVILFGHEMISRGHEIDWVLQSEELCRINYITSWENGRVFVGKMNYGSSPVTRILKHIYNILHDLKSITLINSNQYDIVQVKDKFISTLFIIPFAKLNKSKFTYWLSYPYPEASLYAAKEGYARHSIFFRVRGHFLKFLLYKFIMPAADHIFVQSDQMKKDIITMGINEDKLTAVPMGVEDSLITRPVSSKKVTRSSKTTVIYLGTMAKIRKIDFLIKIFKQVIDSQDNIDFLMVGDSEDPNDLEYLKAFANKLGISSFIIFTGNLNRENALDYVSNSDICLSPFFPTPILNSTSPTKLIEYMAMGKPVIANDHPEQRMVIQESKGGICVPYEVNAFSNAIIELASNPDVSLKMGAAGKNFVRNNRTYSSIANNVEQQYQKLLI